MSSDTYALSIHLRRSIDIVGPGIKGCLEEGGGGMPHAHVCNKGQRSASSPDKAAAASILLVALIGGVEMRIATYEIQ